MIGPNTLIAVRIHNVEYLVSSSNVDYAIFCIDRRDRSCRCDIRRNRKGGHGVNVESGGGDVGCFVFTFSNSRTVMSAGMHLRKTRGRGSYTSQACESCRSRYELVLGYSNYCLRVFRKVKCNGNKPTCAACQKSNLEV